MENLLAKMRGFVLFILAWILGTFTVQAQLKKDGTPDMRYKANKHMYGHMITPPRTSSIYPAPRLNSQRISGGSLYYQQKRNRNSISFLPGYRRTNGTWVKGHYKTKPNSTKRKNYYSF